MTLQLSKASDDPKSLAALLYVSRVAVDPDRLACELANIQTQSIAHNTAFEITGLLIATPLLFAQFLEGPRLSLNLVMEGIIADVRHEDIRIVRRSNPQRRIGGSWRLVRFETGAFEERYVTPLLQRAHVDLGEPSAAALMGLVARLIATPRGSALTRAPRSPR